jgi:CheY-like chemotaxis protein
MAKLVVISPPLTGLTYGLGKQWVTIGRSAGNAFQIVEASISGQHCEVQLRGNELAVRDMRSTNGTFVNGAQVTEAVLKAWDTFRLGDVEIRFEFAAPSAFRGNASIPPEIKPAVAVPVISIPAPAPPTVDAPTTPAVRQNHVLLVDDSMAFLETISELFETMAEKSWRIHQASAADRALAILQEHPIDLAVFDIGMPMLDGVQLLSIAHRRHPDVKKVILTGNASESRRAECLANGAELFLEKPTSPEGIKFVFNVLKDLLVWQQREGFSGTLRHVGLTDVIQIQCLGRNSCILSVNNSQVDGAIYVESGVIVHATAGALAGEEALFKLLSLSRGDFQLKAFVKPAERTVQGSWEFLLMESARKRDEEKNIRVAEDTVVMTKLAPTATAPAAPPVATQSDKDLPAPGDEFIVVSTYDGKWHPNDGDKK